MVSIRCKRIVRTELDDLEISFAFVELGEVEIIGKIPLPKYKELQSFLLKNGLEVMDDTKKSLIEKVKQIIEELVHYSEEDFPEDFPSFLSDKLDCDYKYLSVLFAEVKGITIEQYITTHKIERVKELLVYDELTLVEIANKLQYRNVAHLSLQLKKYTGLPPAFFKKLKKKREAARKAK